MTNRRGVLLASFIITDDEQKIQEEVEFIVNNIEITNNLIFLLQDTENPWKEDYHLQRSCREGQAL